MTQIRLYDSIRREKVDFEPLQPGKASIYLCGPTPYAPAHLGHAYSAICFDVIRRALSWLGFEVTFVRNITDVEDKIFARAAENGEEPLALAERFAAEYNADMARFGVLAPDIEPRVSTHIEDIVGLIQGIIDNGAAYPVDGDVYFSVEAFKPYGQLSGQSLDDLRAGARVEVDARKKAPADFALWKSAKPGELAWDAPWGRGRPGWHIECSAMSLRHLGQTFDIHGGGKDLVFPHHENEIAQSQAAHGEDTFARYWMHNGFLNFSGEKMSKSLGNVFGCRQIADAVGPEALRFFSVSHHYRSPVNFEVDEVDGVTVFRDLEVADRRLDYFYSTLRRLDDFLATGKDPGEGEVVPEADKLVPAAREALADDFNTPIVIAALGEAAKLANKLLDEPKSAPKPVRRRTLQKLARELREVGSAIGVLGSEPAAFLGERRNRLAAKRNIDPAEVATLLEQRAEARKAKDFAAADALRDQIKALGVEVLDTAHGVDWKIAE
ncbi:cysteine--tRNA ligase [Haliangium ochraceum]|uniref:Cysteine--tRNA ligase n=1 Tax=Haliangium ochraceum (strain DSM 14365 / JCM 11303 / SMP-2) TaxID=502025 RepID=D0LUF0_HALO1|nr:cysteine--tRNA ligase [Haliangium ochraceum]ACY19273.1 cysteinyl-tRNA synthetase [Haliangium ochraceum DSM 14365]